MLVRKTSGASPKSTIGPIVFSTDLGEAPGFLVSLLLVLVRTCISSVAHAAVVDTSIQ
jgi:hypothetical protein